MNRNAEERHRAEISQLQEELLCVVSNMQQSASSSASSESGSHFPRTVLWDPDHCSVMLSLSPDLKVVTHERAAASKVSVRGQHEVTYWEISGIDMGRGVPGCSAFAGFVPNSAFSAESIPETFLAIHPFHNPEPKCDENDVFGMGLDRTRGRVLFFKNGKLYEQHVIPPSLQGVPLFPFVCNFTRRIGIRIVEPHHIPNFATIP